MVLLGFPWAAAAAATREVTKDPDKMDFVEFLIPTVIGAAIISLVVTFIIKHTFELDKDDTQSAFVIGLIGLTLLSCIGYFII